MKTFRAIAQTTVPIVQLIIALPFIVVFGGYVLYMHIKWGKV